MKCKQTLRHTMTLVLCCMMLFSIASTAFAAESSVTYQGRADQFVFLPSDDLFDNFKGVMPGDTLLQTITVKNSSSGKVRIYLRAESPEEQYQDFLSKLSLRVEQEGTVLYDGTADKTDSEAGNLSKNVLLGTFPTGTDTTLDVKLTVPGEAVDNRYQNTSAEVVWVFSAEEVSEGGGDWEPYPTPATPTPTVVPVTPTPTQPGSPTTGDDTQLWIWIAGFSACAVVLLILLFLLKKNRQNNH